MRNPNYYIPGQPYLDKITYLLMKEESARIAALRTAGADAFTIGSAAFDATFAPGKPGLIAQLQEILACL